MTEQTYLSVDGVGESPLPDYPGRITFPHVMTLPMHKRWQAFVNGRTKRDPDNADDMSYGIAFVDMGGESTEDENQLEGQRVLFQYDHVTMALMFSKLALTDPDGKKITEKTPEDAIPLAVAVWIAKCYREWENSQLLFRWNGLAHMVAPNSAG